jgi:ABC-type glycerol-3-phosphate transport system permease component
VTASTVVLTLIVSSLCAYALAFIKFPGKKIYFNLAVGTIMFPMVTLVTSYYLVASSLHLTNNLLGMILPASVSGLGVFLLRQYFIKVPSEYIESAKMDGAGHLQIWWHIILPMSRPALAALAIIQFRLSWNDFLVPLYIIRDPHTATLPLLVAFLAGRESAPGLGLATGFLAILIPLLLFIRFHRQFIEGITGGLKG